MAVKILNEDGYYEALYGLGLSHGVTTDIPFEEFICSVKFFQMEKVAQKLAHKGNGHSKFLEAMDVWLEVDETRYFWSEADTYRLTTKQSESTMHKQKLRFEGFTPESPIEKELLEDLKVLQSMSQDFFEKATKAGLGAKGIKIAKMGVVESLYQKRVWKVSYMTLQNIVRQRAGHRLDNWKEFCKELYEQLGHPELIFKGEK